MDRARRQEQPGSDLRVRQAGRHQRDSITPGPGGAGVVGALASGTAGIAAGDEVSGLTGPYCDAAAAGYVAVEARACRLVRER